ncbi:sigma-70 family RNA polymerase sigma factor [Nocardioides sp. SYSU DS0651]|uniref:sigma-70 family RNA polymerase sigma factor n=1 Tax=Nocardioides sp. SYSU DS0651 TaxID=3415955 RepID=UPI003F4B7D6E
MSSAADAHEAALLLRARAGDDSALEDLYAAHVAAARRLASALAGASAAEDLVADAFARVISQLRGGRGPATNFRAYLFTTIRNRYADALRLARRESPVSDQPWLLEDRQQPAEAPEDALLDGFGEDDAVAAFGTLPEKWQRVLWHLEVEGRSIPEVATLLRSSPAAVSSLAYRAREGLRLAYLDRRLGTPPSDRHCRWVQDRLSQYVRDNLSPRATARVEAHVADCVACTTALADLEHTNRRLAALLLPVVLLGGTAQLGAGTALGAGGSVGDPIRDGVAALRRVLRPAGTTAGGPLLMALAAVAVALAAVATVAWWPRAHDTASAPPDPPARTPAPGVVDAPVAGKRPAPVGSTPLRRLRADFVTPAVVPVPYRPPAADPVTAPEPPDPAVPPAAMVEQAAPAPPAGSPTLARPPVTAEPSEPVERVEVTPVAPTATAISGCGTYGHVALPTTDGVRYTLTSGDGQQGPWTVTATAKAGHVLAPGAPTTFSGDLGSHYPCPSIVSAVATPSGVTIDVAASGPAPYSIRVRLDLDADVTVLEDHGAGWHCWTGGASGRREIRHGPEHVVLQGQDWVDCELTYTGGDPAPVVVATAGGVPYSGTATLTADGVERDQQTFGP